MTAPAMESIPTVWCDAADVPFFRLVANLFGRAFCDGATVLLGSYDEDGQWPCLETDVSNVSQRVRVVTSREMSGAS